MNILITGGCGFIGSNIAEYHLNKGHQVSIIDNLSTGSLRNLADFQNNPRLKILETNILNCPELEEFVANADRIYHMAAVLGVFRVLERPVEMLMTNILGSQKILEAAASSQTKARIIIASSSSAYGLTKQTSLNEKNQLVISPATHSLWGYAISKITGEAFSSAYYKEYKLPITNIRFFNTVGPRQTGLYGMVVPRFVAQACLNQPITVFGDGNQTRSFCDVRDSIVAIDMIAENNLSLGEPINIGNDHEISIKNLAYLIKERANSQSEITYTPYQEAYGSDFHDITQRKPDLTKLRELTGFEHQWTLERTVDDLIDKFRHQRL